MNATQKSELISIIQSDCTTRYNYCNSAGETCAVGAMLLACGHTKEELMAIPKGWDNKGCVSTDSPKFVYQSELMHHFGISDHLLRKIQSTNDEHYTPEDRRANIIALIENQLIPIPTP